MMMKYAVLGSMALAGGAHAAALDGMPREIAAPRARIAALAEQRNVLDEEMGRLQLNMLVSDIVGERTAAKPVRPQLTLASARR